MPDCPSLSINSSDTSINKSNQLESAVPVSKISALSSGEFAGMVADSLDQKIALIVFHCEILADFDALKKEEESYQPIPVIRQVDQAMVQRNYLQIKQDGADIIDSDLAGLTNAPTSSKLVLKK